MCGLCGRRYACTEVCAFHSRTMFLRRTTREFQCLLTPSFFSYAGAIEFPLEEAYESMI